MNHNAFFCIIFKSIIILKILHGVCKQKPQLWTVIVFNQLLIVKSIENSEKLLSLLLNIHHCTEIRFWDYFIISTQHAVNTANRHNKQSYSLHDNDPNQ